MKMYVVRYAGFKYHVVSTSKAEAKMDWIKYFKVMNGRDADPNYVDVELLCDIAKGVVVC